MSARPTPDPVIEAPSTAPSVVERLSAGQLAAQTGTTPDHVRRLEELGIIHAGADGTYTTHDVERIHVADGVHGRGISLEDLARAVQAGFVDFAWIRSIATSSLTDRTYAELYADLGLDERWVHRVYATWGLGRPASDAPSRRDDAAILRILATALRAMGGDEERTLAGIRPVGENLRRVGEAIVRWFRTTVIDPGLSGDTTRTAAMARTAELRDRLAPLCEELVHHLYRRSLSVYAHQQRIHLVEDGVEAFGVLPKEEEAPSIAFLDLSGFVRLTEETGDEAAERLASALAELGAEGSEACGGHAVKYLGDGVMLHFTEARGAVAFGMAALPRAAELRLPSARLGIHAGPVVSRDGDFFGRTVNIAARITEYARPGEILASEEVATRSGRRHEFREIGPVVLKGLSDPLKLFATTPR